MSIRYWPGPVIKRGMIKGEGIVIAWRIMDVELDQAVRAGMQPYDRRGNPILRLDSLFDLHEPPDHPFVNTRGYPRELRAEDYPLCWFKLEDALKHFPWQELSPDDLACVVDHISLEDRPRFRALEPSVAHGRDREAAQVPDGGSPRRSVTLEGLWEKHGITSHNAFVLMKQELLIPRRADTGKIIHCPMFHHEYMYTWERKGRYCTVSEEERKAEQERLVELDPNLEGDQEHLSWRYLYLPDTPEAAADLKKFLTDEKAVFYVEAIGELQSKESDVVEVTTQGKSDASLTMPVGVTQDQNSNRVYFRCDGDYWTFGWEGKTYPPVKHMLGFQHIELLLKHKNRKIRCDILRRGGKVDPSINSEGAECDSKPVEFGVQPVADKKTLKAVRDRLNECKEMLAESTDMNRREEFQEEIARLDDYLKAATDKKGQPRTFGGAHENARKSVKKNIEEALKKLEVQAPDIHALLRGRIDTGTSCIYKCPDDEQITWVSSDSE